MWLLSEAGNSTLWWFTDLLLIKVVILYLRTEFVKKGTEFVKRNRVCKKEQSL